MTTVRVKCGKCEPCLSRRVAEWCFRIEDEMKRAKTAYFVTLTYRPDTVKWKYGKMILVKKHLVKFMKRLRINTERSKVVTWENYYHGLNKDDKIIFYGVGEYGSEFGRPHYHLILFNASKKMIEKSWKKGSIDVRKCDSVKINYVLKYLNKRSQGRDKGKPKEFNLQSINIGKKWIEERAWFYRRNPMINYVMNDRGVRLPLPKYFNDYVFRDDEEGKSMKAAMIERTMQENRDVMINKVGADEFRRREMLKRKQFVRRFNRHGKGRKDV